MTSKEPKTEEQKAFEEAAKPLIKYLCENHNPHKIAIVCCHGAEMLEGVMAFDTEEFVKD